MDSAPTTDPYLAQLSTSYDFLMTELDVSTDDIKTATWSLSQCITEVETLLENTDSQGPTWSSGRLVDVLSSSSSETSSPLSSVESVTETTDDEDLPEPRTERPTSLQEQRTTRLATYMDEIPLSPQVRRIIAFKTLHDAPEAWGTISEKLLNFFQKLTQSDKWMSKFQISQALKNILSVVTIEVMRLVTEWIESEQITFANKGDLMNVNVTNSGILARRAIFAAALMTMDAEVFDFLHCSPAGDGLRLNFSTQEPRSVNPLTYFLGCYSSELIFLMNSILNANDSNVETLVDEACCLYFNRLGPGLRYLTLDDLVETTHPLSTDPQPSYSAAMSLLDCMEGVRLNTAHMFQITEHVKICRESHETALSKRIAALQSPSRGA